MFCYVLPCYLYKQFQHIFLTGNATGYNWFAQLPDIWYDDDDGDNDDDDNDYKMMMVMMTMIMIIMKMMNNIDNNNLELCWFYFHTTRPIIRIPPKRVIKTHPRLIGFQDIHPRLK